MNNLSQEQARHIFDQINTSIAFFAILVFIVRIVFVVLLFILVIKAIKYLNIRSKCNCATCKYKQRCLQNEFDQTTTIYPSEDG